MEKIREFARGMGESSALVYDLVMLAFFAVTMYTSGAPTWALWLLLYVGTRPSRLEVFATIRALQSTLRVAFIDPSDKDGEL